MKIAPLLRAFQRYDSIHPLLIHTGQHYDDELSSVFFSNLGIKEPDINLNVGSGTHAVQTASIMTGFEKVCLSEKPSLVVVVGDVNSTIAAGLVAKKLNCTLVHVEAGLRSFDKSMPEEINRIATDALSDIFFVTEEQGVQNLLKEGHIPATIHYVGNVMIDNLFFQLKHLSNYTISPSVTSLKSRLPSSYVCLTLHRPSNVDNADTLETIFSSIYEIGQHVPVIFPCHPRTRKQIDTFVFHRFFNRDDGSSPLNSGVYLINSLGYNEFLFLWKDSTCVITDSGGLQEETTAVKKPCITIRNNTERPITVECGSNILAGTNPQTILSLATQALKGEWKQCAIPPYWDGCASQRIAAILASL
ncbi:MAG: UDP-N-acetylglucosamine 2-epimerase (non-hydrolyzing) [Chitinivibrionales bacterium]|nr:UDP-N-acetylglucosamine 2-epimerase (non-hydrolyzing) [Chitinivibrionales bacterium]